MITGFNDHRHGRTKLGRVHASRDGRRWLRWARRALHGGALDFAGIVAKAAEAIVRHEREVLPDHAWQDRYARMQPVFDWLYTHSQAMYDDLDALID